MKKFKPGDKVYLYREITQEDWDLNGGTGVVPVPFKESDILVIRDCYESDGYGNVDAYTNIRLKESNFGFYPAQCFKLIDPLKRELDKLKSIITNPNNFIKLTRKDRRIFESICNKFNIPFYEPNRKATLDEYIVYTKYRVTSYKDADILLLIKIPTTLEHNIIDFKDIIEPFNKFRK